MKRKSINRNNAGIVRCRSRVHAKAQGLEQGQKYKDLNIYQIREETGGFCEPNYPDYNNKVLFCDNIMLDQDVRNFCCSVLSQKLTDPRRFPIHIKPSRPSPLRCYRFEDDIPLDQMKQQLCTKRPVLAPALFECDLDQRHVRISPETISDPLLRLDSEAISCMEQLFSSMLPMIAGMYEDKDDLRKLPVAVEITKWRGASDESDNSDPKADSLTENEEDEDEKEEDEEEDEAGLDQYNSRIRATAMYVLDSSAADINPIEMNFGQMLTSDYDSNEIRPVSNNCFVAHCEYPCKTTEGFGKGFGKGGSIVYLKDQPFNVKCRCDSIVIRFLLFQPKDRPVVDNYDDAPDIFPRGVTMPEWSTDPVAWFWLRDILYLKKSIPQEVVSLIFNYIANIHVPFPAELSSFKLIPKVCGRYKRFQYDQYALTRFEKFPIFWHVRGQHVVKAHSETKKVTCIQVCYFNYEYVYNVTFIYNDGTKSSHGEVKSEFTGYAEWEKVTQTEIRLNDDQYIEEIRGSSSYYLHSIDFKLSGNKSFELALESQDLAPINFEFSKTSPIGKLMPIIDIITDCPRGAAPAIQGAVFGHLSRID